MNNYEVVDKFAKIMPIDKIEQNVEISMRSLATCIKKSPEAYLNIIKSMTLLDTGDKMKYVLSKAPPNVVMEIAECAICAILNEVIKMHRVNQN